MPVSESKNDRGQMIAALPEHASAITKSDTLDLPAPSRVYVGGAGNVVVITAGGETVTFTSVAAGTVLPVMVTRVMSTNTTATNMVAVY